MTRKFNSYSEWLKSKEEEDKLKQESITNSIKDGGMGTDSSFGQQRRFNSYDEWKKVNRPEEYKEEQAALLKEKIERPRKEYEAKVQEFDTKIQQEKESKWQSKPSIFGWKPLGNIPSKKEKELAAQKAEFTAQTYNKKYSQEYRDKILSEKPKEIKLSDEQYLSLRGDADIRLQYIDMIKDITTTANEDLNKFTQWEVKQTFDGKQTTRKVPFLPTKELVAQNNTYNLQTDWTQAYDYLKKAAKESGMSEEEYARSYNAQISGQMLDIYKKVVGDVSLTKDDIINTTRRTGIPAVDDNQIRIEIENINQYTDTGQRIYEEYAGKREIKKLNNIKEFFSKEGLEYVRDDVLSGTAPFVNMLFNQNQTGFLDTMQLEELKKKLENGGKLTNAETARVLLTEALETNQQIDRGTWTRTAEGVADNLSLIGEMAATWGIFSGASTAVKTTATAATKKISYSAAKEIVEAAASEGGKSWVKTLFTKGAFKEGAKRIASGVATAMIAEIPETIAKDSLKIASEVMTTDSRISFSDPETEEMFLSIVKEDESYNSDWANKLTKAFARQYFNNVLERGGGEIPEGIIDFGADKLKGLIIAKYMSQKGIQTLEEFSKVYEVAGFNGFFGEVFEEYAQDYAESIIDNRDFIIDDPDKFWDIVASVGVMQMGRAGSVATTVVDVTSNIARGITFDTQQQTDQQVPAVEGEAPVDTRTGQDLDTLVTNTQTGESIQDDLQTKEILRQQQVSGETQTVLTEPVDNATLLSKAQALSDISKRTDYSLSSLTELKKLEKQATDEKTAQAIATISSSYTDVLAKKVADGSVNIGQQIDTQLQDNIKEISPDETVQEGIKTTKQQILETPNKEYFVQEKGKFKEIKNAQTVKIINEADTFIYKDAESKLYQVVEAKSGMAIAEASTKSTAIEQATARLNKMGLETFQSKIQEVISKKGISPRYIKKEVKKIAKKEIKKGVEEKVEEKSEEVSPIEKAGLKIGSKIKVQGKLREVSEFGKSARDSQGVLVRFTDGTYITLDKAQEYAAQKQTRDAIKKESTQKTKETIKEAEETVKKLEKEKKVDQNQLAKRRMDIGKTNPEVKKISKDLKDFQESEDYVALKDEYKILLKEARLTHSTLEQYIYDMEERYGEEAATYLEDFMQRWTAAQGIIDTLSDLKTKTINDQLRVEGFEIPKYRKIKNDKLSSKTSFVITNEVSNIVKKYKSSIELEKDYMILYHGSQKEIVGGKLVTGGRIAGETTDENLGKGTDMGGIFFTPDKDFASIFTRWSEAGAGKVHTFLVKTKEMFDVRNPQHYQKLKDFVGKTYKDIDGDDLVFTEQKLNFMVNDGIMDWATFDSSVIEALGFKGVVVTENSDYDNGEPLMTYVLFDGGKESDHYLIPDEIESIEDLYKESIKGVNIDIKHGGVLNPLITLHNITEEKLKLADEAGGLIAPSVAITKPELGLKGFGEITLVGGRHLADPSSDYRNKLYSHDVYSPRVTEPKFDIDRKGLEKIIDSKKWKEAFAQMQDSYYWVEDLYTEDNPKSKLISEAGSSLGLMNLYLKEHGVEVKPVTKTETFPFMDLIDTETFKKNRDFFTKDVEAHDYPDINDNPVTRKKEKLLKQMVTELIDTKFKEKKGAERTLFIEDMYDMQLSNYKLWDMYSLRRGLEKLEKGENLKVDSWETRDLLREEVAKFETGEGNYLKWVEEMFDDILSNPYVVIGGRKLSYTAQNIVDSMFGRGVKGKEGGRSFGINKIKGVASKEYKTVEQARRDRYGKLVDEKQYSEIVSKQVDKLFEWSNKIKPYSRFFAEDATNLENALADYGKGSRSWNNFISSFSRNGYDFDPENDRYLTEKLKKWADRLFTDPVPYLEGKLRRVVDIGEFEGAIIPMSYKGGEIEQLLRKNGIKRIEYLEEQSKKAPELQRADVLQSKFDDIKYRMSSGLDTILTQEQIENIEKLNDKWFGDNKVNVVEKLLSEDGQKVLGRYYNSWIDLLKKQTNIRRTYIHEGGHKGWALSGMDKEPIYQEIFKTVGLDELQKKWGNYPNESLAKYLYETNRREGHRGYDEITSMADIRRNLDILRKDKQRKLTKEDELVEEAKGWLLLSDKEVSELNEYDREDYNKYLKPQLEAIAIDGLDDGEIVVIKGGTDGKWVDTDIKIALNRGVSANTLVLIVKENEIESTGNEAKDNRGERLLTENIFEQSEYNQIQARYRGSNYSDDKYIWAEEEFCERFIDYVEGRETFTGQIKQFFDDLLEFIKSLVGAESQVKKLYREIYTGKLSTKQMDNIQKQYVPNYRDGSSNTLIAEARKYKSADEFIKAQGEVLYHGTPFKFSDFKKGKTTFFTPDRKFAEDYGYDKSFARELDADIQVLERYGKLNIFDSKNKDHVRKIKDLLPKEIDIMGAMAGMGARISKSEFLERIQGVFTHNIPKFAEEATKVGEIFNDMSIKNEGYWRIKEIKKNSVIAEKIEDPYYAKDKENLKIYKTEEYPRSGTYKEYGEPYWKDFEGDQNIEDVLKKAGFDGYKMTEKDSVTYGIFNPEKLLSKSQLIDIWNESQKIKPKYRADLLFDEEVEEETPKKPKAEESLYLNNQILQYYQSIGTDDGNGNLVEIDINDDPVADYLKKANSFELKDVSIDLILANNPDIKENIEKDANTYIRDREFDEYSDEFTGEGTYNSPIIIDKNGGVLDGYGRINLAINSGETVMKAYVEVKDANKKPKKEATLEITKTPEAGVVYDVKGSSILPSRKLQQQIEETLMSGQSTPATRSITAFMPVIETTGKIKDSRAFEKIQDRYAEIQELDPSLNELKYQSMSIADITAKAMAFVDEYPAEARRVALGMELAPEGTTNIAVSLAYTEKMFEEGKWKQAREADRALSLRGTRLGQEIVSFKGRLNANSPMFFMEQVLNARRMVVSSRMFKSGSLENFAKMKQERMAEVAKTLKQIKLEKAEDFINKLIC